MLLRQLPELWLLLTGDSFKEKRKNVVKSSIFPKTSFPIR
jgi:hypothetical protein